MGHQKSRMPERKSEGEPQPVKHGILRTVVSWLSEIAIVIVIVTVFQVGLVQAYHVPTGSMEPTIMTGDFLIADKVTLGPRTPQWIGIPYTNLGVSVPTLKLPGLRKVERNDVIVVQVPVDQKTPYVKRVVALEGLIVQVKRKQLYVDGVPQVEPWAEHSDPDTLAVGVPQYGIPAWLGNRDNWGPYRVPKGRIFLMGDNRDNSFDSRYFGPVDESAVIGRARLTMFSIDTQSPGKPLASRFSLARFGRLLN